MKEASCKKLSPCVSDAKIGPLCPVILENTTPEILVASRPKIVFIFYIYTEYKKMNKEFFSLT